MDERKSNQRLWIIIVVAIILGLLVVCAIGAVAGGIAGYIAGRRAARGYLSSPQIIPITPTPRARLLVPTPQEPEGSPEEPFTFGVGALVTDVIEDSPAERAGIRRGDIIVEIDGRSLKEGDNLTEIIQEYKPGDRVELRIVRGGRSRTLTVRLERNPNKPGNVPWLGLYYRLMPWTELEIPELGD